MALPISASVSPFVRCLTVVRFNYSVERVVRCVLLRKRKYQASQDDKRERHVGDKAVYLCE